MGKSESPPAQISTQLSLSVPCYSDFPLSLGLHVLPETAKAREN